MKKINLLLLFFVFAFGNAQNYSEKEKKFNLAVQNVISYYNEKNSEKFNCLINKKTGFYIIARVGVNDFWYNNTTVCFTNDCNIGANFSENYIPDFIYEQMSKQKLNCKAPLQYAKYPDIDCENASKKGLFVDIDKKDHLLSDIIKGYIKYNDLNLSKKYLKQELKKVSIIEPISRKIVLVSDFQPKEGEVFYGNIFIFYLSYINEQWYITIIDFVSADCSV